MTSDAQEKYRLLLRRQHELNREYEAFLEQHEESFEGPVPLPPHLGFPSRTVYINRRCALDRDNEGNLGLVTLPGQRALGLKELRDFTVEAESLIVVDPFVFSGNKASAKVIAAEFERTARVAGKWLKRVHFIYDQSHMTNSVKAEIEGALAENNVRSTRCHSDVIHDRLWIADRSRAIVVGTSFNGIGGRAAFLLPLPEPDLNALLEFLDENSLTRAETSP
jgi:hypothetical protein